MKNIQTLKEILLQTSVKKTFRDDLIRLFEIWTDKQKAEIMLTAERRLKKEKNNWVTN